MTQAHDQAAPIVDYMNQIGRQARVSFSGCLHFMAAFAVFAVIQLGCGTTGCYQPLSGELLIQIGHVSGGDAPVVYVLAIYQDGMIQLDKVGFRTYCATITPDELASLRSLVDPQKIGEMQWSPLAGGDRRMAQITVDDKELRVVLDQPPEELRALLGGVDSLFDAHFDRKYDMPLLSP